MKTTNKLLMAVILLASFNALADPERVYERLSKNNSGQVTIDNYKFYDSENEIGYRYFPAAIVDNPCLKGFIKLSKSVESNAILYTAEKKLSTCDGRRFVFPNGDMSSFYLQGATSDGNFKHIAESLKDWADSGIKPSGKLLN